MRYPLALAVVLTYACSRAPLHDKDGGGAGVSGNGSAGAIGGSAPGPGSGGAPGPGAGGVAGASTGGVAGDAPSGGTGGEATGGVGGSASGGANAGTGGAANPGTGGVTNAGSGGASATGGGANAGTGGAATAGAGGAGGTGGAAGAGSGGAGAAGATAGGAGRGGAGGVTHIRLGEPCVVDSECTTGFCTDGVCCNVSCRGACISCNQAVSPGRCLPVAAGAPDPRGQCVATSAVTCGLDGKCDGAGACRTYVPGTVCSDESCGGTTYSSPRRCDGAGTCLPPTATSCVPYRCAADGKRCLSSCTGDPHCTPPFICRNGFCGREPELPPCAGDEVCASGHCAQGVCCATACQGPCNSCALPGSAGTCARVPNPDPSWNCP